MLMNPERLKMARLPQEEILENDIKKRQEKQIGRLVREIEAYFIDIDYEELARSTIDEKEDLKAAEIERQMALAHGIIVTNRTSPRLYALVEQAISNLGIDEVKNLTIIIQRYAEPTGEEFYNAFCVMTRSGSVFISFTPMLLNILNDFEVMDVIGHELGHAIAPLPPYLDDYFYFVWGGWMDGVKDLDPDIPESDFMRINEDIQDIIDAHFDMETDSKIVRLIRLKEMTADRFGLVASRSHKDSCASLMKQQTLGIDERFFDYNPHHLIRQLDELSKMRKDPAMRWIFDATHPVLPARVAALDAFYHSLAYKHIVSMGDSRQVNIEFNTEEKTYSDDEMSSIVDQILIKSEIMPEREDLVEIKLVACLFFQILLALSVPAKSHSKIVRRMVWEKYRNLYAAIPGEVFELETKNFKRTISKFGKVVSRKDDRDRRALIRGIIGFLKEKRLLRHETKNFIMQTGLSLGLKRSVIINYLKRVGAWGRYVRKR